MHPRTEIRKAAASILKAAGVSGGKVEPDLYRFAQPNQAPICGVYTLEEQSDPQETSPRTYLRLLTLHVEVLHRVTEGLDDALDEQAEAVELALLSDPTLGGKAEDCVLINSLVTIVRDGDAPHGSCRMDFQVTYRTDEPTPSDLDDFMTAHADWHLDKDGEPDATDEVKLPTE